MGDTDLIGHDNLLQNIIRIWDQRGGIGDGGVTRRFDGAGRSEKRRVRWGCVIF